MATRDFPFGCNLHVSVIVLFPVWVMSNPVSFCLFFPRLKLRCIGIPVLRHRLKPISFWVGGHRTVTSEFEAGDRDRDPVATAFCDLLEMLGTPSLLLDKRGFVLAANALLRRSLGSELQVANGRLVSPDAGLNAAVSKIIKCLVNGERQSPPRALSIRRTNDLPIVLYGFQLAQSALELFDPVRAILVLVDPRSKSLPSETQLKDAFGLSWMEAKVVLCLAGGLPWTPQLRPVV